MTAAVTHTKQATMAAAARGGKALELADDLV
jgi:hypothetical protein